MEQDVIRKLEIVIEKLGDFLFSIFFIIILITIITIFRLFDNNLDIIFLYI
jgi:hypothetical protein